MMLNLYVQQHQWIVTALLSGGALMLLFWLTYSAMWRSRESEEISEPFRGKGVGSLLKSVLSIVPWVLILLAMTCTLFAFFTLLSKTCKPPNW